VLKTVVACAGGCRLFFAQNCRARVSTIQPVNMTHGRFRVNALLLFLKRNSALGDAKSVLTCLFVSRASRRSTIE
jgi:hypothetical protein